MVKRPMDEAEQKRLDEKFEGIKPLFGDPEYASWAASKKKRPQGKKLRAEAEKKVREEIEAGKITVEELLEGSGYEDGAPIGIRLLAERAIEGGTTDITAFLQQTGQLRAKPKATEVEQADGLCPHCGETLGSGPETLVLSDKATEGLESARNMALENALSEYEPEHPLLCGEVA